MKLDINDTNVSNEDFRDDLKTYATQWIFEKQAAIYSMADDIRRSPLLVNILHEWAAAHRLYEAEKAELEEKVADIALLGKESGYTLDQLEESRDFAYRLHGKPEYKRILDDAIFHSC